MRLRYRLILSFLMLALIPLLLINIQANLAINRLSNLRNDQIRLVVDTGGDSAAAISREELTRMLNEDQVSYDKEMRSAKINLIFTGLLLTLIILGTGIWIAVKYASLTEKLSRTASRALNLVQRYPTDIGTIREDEQSTIEGIAKEGKSIPREEEKQLQKTFDILETSIQEKLSNLEKQVKGRTDELKIFSDRLLDLESIVHEAVEAQGISNLLNISTEKISHLFGYSHVGIFLLDKSGQYIELKAEASGSVQDLENQDSGLRRMGRLEKNYRLKVSDGKSPRFGAIQRDGENQSEGEEYDGYIPGYVAATGEVYQSADLSKEELGQPGLDLSTARSEIALPLRTRGALIGVLDVHSTRLEKFAAEEIAMLNVIADQLALAIDNARFLEQSQQGQDKDQGLYSDFTRNAWDEMIRSRPEWGYRSEEQGIFRVEGEWHPWMVKAAQQGQVVVWQEGGYTIASVPIRVRDYTLGVLDFRKAGDTVVWTTDELALVQTLTDQLGQALESARLYQNTQLRAERERILADITSKVRASTNVNVILQTAVKELAEALRVPKGAIQLRGAGREGPERQTQSSGGGQVNG